MFFLFRLLDISIICEHIYRAELRQFLRFCVAHLSSVKQEIRTKFNFGHSCPK